MKTLLINMTALIAFVTMIPNFAKADVGHGGMAECIAQSVQVALNAYSQTNTFSAIPNVVVSKSNASPSNGIDIMVTVNGQTTYYVIASPSQQLNSSGTPIGLLGCNGARIR